MKEQFTSFGAVHTELNVAHPDGGRGALEDLLEIYAREAAREAREQHGDQADDHVSLDIGRGSRAVKIAVLRAFLRCFSSCCYQIPGTLCCGLCIIFRLRLGGHLRRTKPSCA